MSSKIYIGVLLGAGPRISNFTNKSLKSLLRRVFAAAKTELDKIEDCNECEILDLTVKLAQILEDSPHTNAGRGSELTIDGTIECDASVILAYPSLVTASVGAVPNTAHPTDLCAHLIKLQLDTNPANLSRSTPNRIVGPHARDYGIKMGWISADPEPDLITERAKRSYEKWQKRLVAEEIPDRFTDTVGLIVVVNGITCVVSSSGGALLKDPGRVGPAFVVGAGLDCQGPSSAVCSGFGEDIMTSGLAALATRADQELSSIASCTTKVHLQRPPAQFGILRATVTENDGVLFDWIHTTSSMVCGFGSVCRSEPPAITTIVSQRPQQGGRHIR